MTKSVFIASSERQVSKSSIALGVIDLFARQVRSVGVFRPLVASSEHDAVTEAMLSQKGVNQSFESAIGVSYTEWADDPAQAIDTIVAKYNAIAETRDAVVILGSDYEDIDTSSELAHNATIAANLNSPVLFVCRAEDRSVEQVRRLTEAAIEAIEQQHNTVIGIVASHAAPAEVDALKTALGGLGAAAVSVLPYNAILRAPSVGEQFDAVGATQWLGQVDFRRHESLHSRPGGSMACLCCAKARIWGCAWRSWRAVAWRW